MMHKIYYIDSLVNDFFTNFNTHYADALATDFNSLSLPQQVDYIKHLYKVSACRQHWYTHIVTLFSYLKQACVYS